MAGIARKFIKSSLNAFRGIAILFNSQLNARIELTITIIVIFSGFLLQINLTEWIAVLLCIALVLGLEGMNTAIEIFADKLHPDFDTEIGRAKDVAAGAVLIAAIVAAIIGFIIFVPRLLDLINSFA